MPKTDELVSYQEYRRQLAERLGDEEAAKLVPFTDNERFEFLERQLKKTINSRGISFDRVLSVDGAPSGFRFMRRWFIGEPKKTLRQAIDDGILHERTFKDSK